MIFKRDSYINKLINNKNNSFIKVITGIRRCGKSYLLFNLYYNYLLSIGVDKKHIIAINLENDEYENLYDRTKLREYIKSKI
uniref:AAA family ATPase n=1 Tax=Candidatus Ruminimicrobium bovinum TaxID=3242779 RepID=UPI0039B88F79